LILLLNFPDVDDGPWYVELLELVKVLDGDTDWSMLQIIINSRCRDYEALYQTDSLGDMMH